MMERIILMLCNYIHFVKMWCNDVKQSSNEKMMSCNDVLTEINTELERKKEREREISRLRETAGQIWLINGTFMRSALIKCSFILQLGRLLHYNTKGKTYGDLDEMLVLSRVCNSFITAVPIYRSTESHRSTVKRSTISVGNEQTHYVLNGVVTFLLH